MNDELMISMLGNQVTKNVPVPSQTDIDAYIAAHPDMFASAPSTRRPDRLRPARGRVAPEGA